MKKHLLNPSARLVAAMFAVAAAFLAASALAIKLGGNDVAVYGFLSLFLGLTVLFIALASFTMRKLNLKYGPPKD